MNRMLPVALLVALVLTGSAGAFTPTRDGVLTEWIVPPVLDLGSQPAPSVNNYRLLAGWDATDLHIGMDRNATDRYLGDTFWDNDSFFVAVDTDGISGSGGSTDAYGNINFGGPMKPDRVYSYAGGAGWHERHSWNGSAWDSLGWTDANTYYGWQEANPDDELTISLSEIGGSANVMIWAWMTRENNGWIEASWPSGSTGDHPTMGNGIMLPEPATLVLVALGAVGVLRRRSR